MGLLIKPDTNSVTRQPAVACTDRGEVSAAKNARNPVPSKSVHTVPFASREHRLAGDDFSLRFLLVGHSCVIRRSLGELVSNSLPGHASFRLLDAATTPPAGCRSNRITASHVSNYSATTLMEWLSNENETRELPAPHRARDSWKKHGKNTLVSSSRYGSRLPLKNYVHRKNINGRQLANLPSKSYLSQGVRI